MRNPQHFYAITAIDNSTGREVGWSTRAVWVNVLKCARHWARTMDVTITVVRVEPGESLPR
jgi:hypothetical protein